MVDDSINGLAPRFRPLPHQSCGHEHSDGGSKQSKPGSSTKLDGTDEPLKPFDTQAEHPQVSDQPKGCVKFQHRDPALKLQ